MNPIDETRELWHIVWTPTINTHWIFNWLHPDYAHCLAVKKSKGGQFWIIVNPANSHVDVQIEPVSKFTSVQELISNYTCILTVSAKYEVETHNKHFGFSSCTDMCKALLGIKDPLCFTPYQLFKKLSGGHYGRCTTTRTKRSEASSAGTTESASRTKTNRTTQGR